VNYLGHFILSHPNQELVTGNFIGDFVKGNDYLNYPEGISRGIKMHRFIDEYTDTHESSMHCKSLLRPIVGKLSGVALDILYDHILANNFSNHATYSLTDFAGSCYTIISERKSYLPLKGRYVFYHMKKNNWLCRYDSAEGIQTTLRNMSRRIQFENNLLHSYNIYLDHKDFINLQFERFFASLRTEVRNRFYPGL